MRPYMKPRVLPYGVRCYDTGNGITMRGFVCGVTDKLVILMDEWLMDKLLQTTERI